MCISSIKRLLKRIFHGPVKEEPAPAAPAEEKKPWDKRGLLYRPLSTRRGGPNMPKRQPCPAVRCGKNCKRGNKTMGGAYYICPNHGDFFVQA